MRSLFSLLLAGACATTLAPSASAQAASSAGPHVLVAVADRALPTGVRALVVRTAGERQPDLIVLAPDASAVHTLAAAAALLKAERRAEPVATRTVVHHLSYTEATRRDPGLQGRMEAVVAQVRSAEVRNIEGVGTVRVASLPLALLR